MTAGRDAQALFEPLALERSGLQLKNRLVLAPMPTFAAANDGAASDAEIAYYRRRAEGGVAAVITAGCAIRSDGLSFPGQWRCDADRFIPSLAAVARTIRAAGAQSVLQLSHQGFSDLSALTETDKRTLIASFAAAARRGREAGFDAIELHGGHGCLLQQFASPRTNPRSGAWSGSRFPLAAAEACAPCWYRLDPEETGERGLTIELSLELAAALSESSVDVFDVAARDYFGGSIRDPADRRPRARLMHEAVGDRSAVMAVGRIATVEQALAALADGPSLAGLGRVTLGEPDWANKVAAGRENELRLGRLPGDTLRKLQVPEPVIDFLDSKGRLR